MILTILFSNHTHCYATFATLTLFWCCIPPTSFDPAPLNQHIKKIIVFCLKNYMPAMKRTAHRVNVFKIIRITSILHSPRQLNTCWKTGGHFSATKPKGPESWDCTVDFQIKGTPWHSRCDSQTYVIHKAGIKIPKRSCLFFHFFSLLLITTKRVERVSALVEINYMG